MIVIIDERDEVINAYRSMFSRIGHQVIGMNTSGILDWLEGLTKEDIETTRCFLIGQSKDENLIVSALRNKTKVPVIAMLETGSLDETLKRFDIGVDDVVRKPVHVREILARIAAIGRRERAATAYVDLGRLHVYPDGRDVMLDGKPFPLPRRERRVLEFLAANLDRLVSRGQVFNAIYGPFEDEIEECVVESHISKLRKKLQRALGCNVIESRRYLGYKLNVDALKQSATPEKRPATSEAQLHASFAA